VVVKSVSLQVAVRGQQEGAKARRVTLCFSRQHVTPELLSGGGEEGSAVEGAPGVRGSGEKERAAGGVAARLGGAGVGGGVGGGGGGVLLLFLLVLLRLVERPGVQLEARRDLGVARGGKGG
jgi:hypothetical protein